MISPPPLELLRSGWFPYVAGIFQRVSLLLRIVPGLTATSWFRTAATNRRVGGDPESQHLFAIAVDLDGSDDALRRAQAEAPRVGLIPVREPSHLHVQLFPRGALARVGVRFPV